MIAGAVLLPLATRAASISAYWPSDVIAGWSAGLAWAAFCALGCEALANRHRLDFAFTAGKTWLSVFTRTLLYAVWAEILTKSTVDSLNFFAEVC